MYLISQLHKKEECRRLIYLSLSYHCIHGSLNMKKWIQDIRGYYDRGKFVVNIGLIYWSVRLSRGWGKVGGCGKSLFQPSVSINLHENLVQLPSNNISIYKKYREEATLNKNKNINFRSYYIKRQKDEINKKLGI